MSENGKPTGEQVHSKRQIRNFLIDRKFQMAWVLRVAVVVTIIVSVMGYFLYGTLQESIELTNAQILSTASMTQQAQQAIVEKGAKDKVFTGVVLAGTLAGLVVLLSLMTIVVTHKVAGPAYKIKRLLSAVDANHLQLFEQLRRGDELHDVFREFTDMLRRLRESRHLDVERLESVIQTLEAAQIPKEKFQPMVEIVKQYKESIEMQHDD
ncbi:MAG: hypothetical protein JXR76_24255 [Deltaproteobacteria bacterium]|nr:hypothetical protein [Deltaproteobacteria bacterium]